MAVHRRESPSLPSAGHAVVEWRAGPAGELEGRIESAFQDGALHVVVDLEGSELVDSALLAMLHRVGPRLRTRGARVSVVCSHPGLASLLRLTMLDRSFAVFPSRDAALRAAP